jgi:hypothetical protein
MADSSEEEIPKLQDELARVAKQTARLLLQPRYDEAELAELDARARELRARIQSACVTRDADVMTEFRVLPTHTVSGSLSGG